MAEGKVQKDDFGRLEGLMLLELSKSMRLLGKRRVDEQTIPTLLSVMHTNKSALVALLRALPSLHLFQMSHLERCWKRTI
jgi:hypothetical protein